MGISDEIERIAAEFVPVCVVIDALLRQEGVTPHQLSLWLQRNLAVLSRIPILDFSYDAKNFIWRDGLRDAIGDSGIDVYEADGEFNYAAFASYENDNFVPGWRASDLRDFFSTTSVKYPEKGIDELLKAEHWRIAIEALKKEQQAEREKWRQSFTHPKNEQQRDAAATEEADGKLLSTRERNTLLRLVIGMAVDFYGYDPTAPRSPVPGELAKIMAGLDMSVDPDTVRKYLKEAAETVLPTKLPKP